MPRQGRVEKERIIELRIPPGVDTGTACACKAKASPGPMADQLAICTLSSM